MAAWDRTPSRPRTVIIEEYYREIGNGDIYRYWRFEGYSNWHSVKTAYKKLPYELFQTNAEPEDLEDDSEESQV